jgi:hypothetical protein
VLLPILIKTELARLGWPESHDRITAYLSKARVTCLDALPETAQQTLLGHLQKVSAAPVDYADLLVEIDIHCDRLGLTRNGVTLRLWLQSQGLNSLLAANADQLIDLRDFLKECRPDPYTIPVSRILNKMYAVLSEILDILQGVAPTDRRVAMLKETLSQWKQ